MPAKRKPVMRDDPNRATRSATLFHVVFLIMFLIFGLGIVRDGYRSIHNRDYNLKYTETLSVASGSGGGIAWVEEKSADYHGKSAVVFGVGFMSLGAMLLVWATGLAVGLVEKAGVAIPRPVYRTIAALSLATLTLASLTLFQPWRLHTFPFYLVLVAFTLAVTLPIKAELRKKVFPAAVGLVVLVGMTNFPAFPIFAGIFVFMAGGTNILTLWPSLGERLVPQYRKPR